jgi:hypothetical protein
MALDFTTGVLDSRVTVTRALNTATAINSSGFIAIVNANLPRFDYDPVTLAPKGLLIEESRTNILTYSEQFDNAIWVKTGSTVTANSATSPDGTVSADQLANTSFSTGMYRFITATNGATYTTTVYAKYVSGNVNIRVGAEGSPTTGSTTFNISSGTIVSNGVSVVSSSITPAGNDWYRCSVTFVATSTSVGLVYYSSNSAGTFLIWGAQFEAGAFATSYIPTVASQVTRNPDLVSMTGTNFSDWYNATESSVVIQYGGQSSFGRAFTFSDGTAANQIWIEPAYTVRAGAATQYTTSIPGITYPAKVGLVFKQNRFAAVANGGSVVSGASGNIPVVDRLFLGSNATGAGSFVNNTIAKFMYYPQALLNAEARAFSK